MSRYALITGASSGIGQALAARYAAARWRLALVARRGHDLDRKPRTGGEQDGRDRRKWIRRGGGGRPDAQR